MKISVFGIGYVGAVTSACLAASDHEVTAVDVDAVKVDSINAGRAPIFENGLDELIAKTAAAGKLRATQDGAAAIRQTEISLICVGTPGNADGSLNLKYIEIVCEQIGAILKEKNEFHTVVIRSTVIPGTLQNFVRPILEAVSDKKAGQDFGLANNPEFLREGSAIRDYYSPTQIVVGAEDERAAMKVMALYEGIDAPRVTCAPEVAEGVKYVSNAWRANKVSFANEMGNILKQHGVDSHRVMDVFFQDTKINLGKSFLVPGFAFGGSCLPKDVRAITASANDKGLATPFFDSLLAANQKQIERAFAMIRASSGRRIGLLGVSFKPGTDDLRESPLAALALLLLEAGMSVSIYDPCVFEAAQSPRGENMRRDFPHVTENLVGTAADLKARADIIVIGNAAAEFAAIARELDESVPIIDLARPGGEIELRRAYKGICW